MNTFFDDADIALLKYIETDAPRPIFVSPASAGLCNEIKLRLIKKYLAISPENQQITLRLRAQGTSKTKIAKQLGVSATAVSYYEIQLLKSIANKIKALTDAVDEAGLDLLGESVTTLFDNAELDRIESLRTTLYECHEKGIVTDVGIDLAASIGPLITAVRKFGTPEFIQCENCKAKFVASRKGQRFCSPQCMNRSAQKKQNETPDLDEQIEAAEYGSPEYIELAAERERRYYATREGADVR